MKRIFASLLVFGFTCFSITGFAQMRSFGAEALVIDNGAGQTITIQTPSSGWSGNIPFVIPIPPSGNPPSGFVHLGTASGQILEWNPADGSQGAWDVTTLGDAGGITGTGTSGFVPLWSGTSTQTNSAIADDGSTVSVTNGQALLLSGTTGVTPASGEGTRMEWIPAKAAFRAGDVFGTEWDDANIGSASIALGEGVTASGDYSTALGDITTASGSYSTALGLGSIANNYASTAIGWGTTASGAGSTSMGAFTTASGDYSTAIGANAFATGDYSTAMGWYASTNSMAGAFVYGDHSTTTVMNANNPNEFDVRSAGGVNFYTKSDLSTGVSFPANGGLNLAGGAYQIDDNTVFYADASGQNVFAGVGAGASNSGGTWNVAVGYQALYSNTSGSANSNTALGFQALYSNTTGYFNTAVANGALYTNTIGTFNTAIGMNADVGSNNLTNSTAIGANAVVTQSNTIQLGDANVQAVVIPVGTTAKRPATPVQGMIRYNTTTGKFEGYDGSAWQNLN